MSVDGNAVDVGIVTHNTRELTLMAVERLSASSASQRLRVLVHDNASKDGTAQALASLPGVDVERSPENLGFAAGVNRLLDRSNAPYFLALNSDAWPDPGAIDRLVETLRDHPRAAAAAPRLERPDGTLEHSTHPFPSLPVAMVCAAGGYQRWCPRLARRWMLNGAWPHDEARSVDWAVGAALMLRRDAVEDAGWFDESFFMYAEDLEWCWRARQRGWEIRFEPSAVVRHVGNASGAAVYGTGRTQAHVRNLYRFYRRSHGPVSVASYRAVNVMGCVRLYLGSLARGDAEGRAWWVSNARAHVGSHA